MLKKDLLPKILQTIWTAALIGLSLSLAACGGGGGDPTGTSNSATGTPSGQPGGGGITPANATYTVTWNAVSDPNVTGYRLYYSTSPLNGGITPSHVDLGLTLTSFNFVPANYSIPAGTTLYVAVTGFGPGGLESPPSNVASIAVQ